MGSCALRKIEAFSDETGFSARLAALPSLRQVMTQHRIEPRRALGQHFLLDLNLTSRIARAGLAVGYASWRKGSVIEIGPGPGGLTRALLSNGAAQVIAIEKDSRAIAALAELATIAQERLSIIEADALMLDVTRLGETPRRIIANLPYNIASQLLVRWLEALYTTPNCLESLTLMFQKEMACRLIASPGSADYGRLAVLTHWLCEGKRLFDLSPQAFTPPPRVISTLIQLTPRPAPLYPASLMALQKVVGAAFGQRRKMLRTALKTLGIDALELLTTAGIAPTRRGESLDLEEFCVLARLFEKQTENKEDRRDKEPKFKV